VALVKTDREGGKMTWEEGWRQWQVPLVIGLLIALGMAVFWPVVTYDFVNITDDLYVYENNLVTRGVTLDGLVTAFTSLQLAFWHPLTLVSLMIDREVFGPGPGGFHLTSLLLHLLNTVFLFAVLRRMTGTLWRGALVAALFTVHPLHVEPVAWISERKEVLSAFFWMMTLLAYRRYVERPRPGRYAVLFLALTAGLMAKTMLVTVPFLLLVLDWWPLGRFLPGRPEGKAVHRFRRIVMEKIPLLVPVAVVSWLSIKAQEVFGALGPVSELPVVARFLNVPLAYVDYLGKLLWPFKLAPFYPHPGPPQSLVTPLACLAVLLTITVFVAKDHRRYPFAGCGWMWFLGTLVPVIGLVQIGSHLVADRNTYIPYIGLFIVIIWGGDALVRKKGMAWTSAAAGAAVIVLACLSVVASSQVRVWKNSITLYTHTMRVSPSNWLAMNNLGFVMEEEGKLAEAEALYAASVASHPRHARHQANYGRVLAIRDRIPEAIERFRIAVSLEPEVALYHYNLGVLLAKAAKAEEAKAEYRRALEIEPGNAKAWYNLGVILLEEGKTAEAAEAFRSSIRFEPGFAPAYSNLGNALEALGSVAEARQSYLRAVLLDPQLPQPKEGLARLQERGGALTPGP
jgi:Tfp pilus assembly protein PilF